MSFGRIGIIVVLTAVAVFVALNRLLPHRQVVPALASGPSVDEVFGNGATPSAAAASAKGGDGLTAEEARRIAEEVSRRVAAEVAEQVLEQQLLSAPPKPRDAAPPAPAPAAKQSLAEAEPLAEATPAPAPPAAHAARPKAPPPKTPPPAKPEVLAKAPAPSVVIPPAPKKPSQEAVAEVVSPWWNTQVAPSAAPLRLVYVGEVAGSSSIALLFSSTFSDANAAGSHLQVLNADGRTVHGQWALGANPKMLTYKVATPGRYSVLVSAGLTDAQGHALGSDLHGPVYVH